MGAVRSTTRSDCTTQDFAEKESQNNQDVEGENGNSAVIGLDLHMTGNEHCYCYYFVIAFFRSINDRTPRGQKKFLSRQFTFRLGSFVAFSL